MSTASRFVALALGAIALAATVSASAAAPPITLEWTAPGDDSARGRATGYELRYSQAPITVANFHLATLVSGVPAPSPAGLEEQFVLSALLPSVTYYFALRSVDEAGNVSGLSNVAMHQGTNVGTAGSTATLWFSLPWPNPVRDEARWNYTLPRATNVTVDVFDLAGHHVRSLARGTREAGDGELRWDLHDDAGRDVAAGHYYVRAVLGGQTWVRQITVVR